MRCINVYRIAHAMYVRACSAGSEGNQHSLLQQSGLQLRLLVNVCSHDITSLAYSAAAHAVVAGDACGGVLAIDVSTPAVMW